jgi:ribonucleases P/MRP protein subunit RPP40
MAFITPVHKGGVTSEVQNYRPISKLCLFANEFITSGMEGGSQVDVIYTDYRKCFDRIDHKMLMLKLHVAGIHGDLLRWFASYIERRSQSVVLQGFSSAWIPIPSGVPQGSILGPLLFTIFIMDISDCFRHSKILLFADDMKVLKVISFVSDVHELQEDLNRFQSYCSLNKLDLNVSKCFYITFSRKLSVIDLGYELLNEKLKRVNEVKDLGVIHDSKLIFDKHIDCIVRKASKALGFIMRASVEFRTLKSVKILYCAFVRSHLEYASQVWYPQYAVHINRIERIQKQFLRYLDYKAHVRSNNYQHRCKRYHFLPLETRRNISDVCYLAQIATGVIDSPELLSKIYLSTNLLRFRSRSILHIPSANSNYKQNTFLIRSSRNFSKLSTDIDLFCTSIASIKRNLTKSYFEILKL